MKEMQLNRKQIVTAAAVLICIILAVSLYIKIEMNDSADDMIIKTDYCNLYYPSRWKDTVVIMKEEALVRFLAGLETGEETPLFDVHFGSEEGTFCQWIRTKKGSQISVSVTVHSVTPDDSWNQEQIDMLYAMQEDLNHLCSRLPVVEAPRDPAREEQPQETPVYEDIEIVTPYGRLSYPGIWETYLRMNVVEEDTYVIEFHAVVADHPQQHLFDVSIGPDVDSRYQFCTAKDGTVYWLALERHALETDDSWTEAEMDILYGMMESADDLLRDLVPVEEERLSVEPGVIETPYGQLLYPGEMKQTLRWEEMSSEPYILAFYGYVGDHPQQHLYDISIGTDLEDPYGTIMTPDGNTAQIAVRYYPFTPDSGWTEEQADAIYAMQETANQILEQFALVEMPMDMQPEETASEDILIKTPYGELRYPGKWANNVRIQRSSGKPYLVRFYGHAGSIAEQHLFSLAFGGNEGVEVATVADARGHAVNVYLISAGITGEEGKDKDQLYAMLEDSNYLIESLDRAGEES